ncbi:GNAT family N-acetyltransferase [Providencia rettgeri]|uniref:GNAT family N-acetyltransferase n=1 Tax=Providencia rettgeri TaxID=587 RepID=A0AAW6UF42_PRORE|nr:MULTISPECIES: GNAT family N-acetyltransferase [Providencia]MBG5891948.1 GNAT family N-acetyltransferase [Providencia rettgeri]MBQ0530072.1 GNAT family N-acetyltransferase [Providencia rettgeri]MDI9091963.1 GNAT family N-acetyltransferase [Providencia rettgeri]MDT2035270.1 GNAT family N-acetyltransferase [Providencia rettgeri]THB26733.1 GNAT family N-acetyltransferase [Providencia sp. MGF014]
MQIKHSMGYTNPELLTDAFNLRQQVFTQEQGFPADIDVDEYDESALHVVLYLDGQPAAVLRCVLLEDNLIKVGRVAVQKSHRSKGLGRELMKFVEQYGRSHHYHKIALSAQYTVIDFYHTLGYQTEGEMYDEEGMDHIYMTLSLE